MNINRDNIIKNSRDYQPFRRNFLNDLFYPFENFLAPENSKYLSFANFSSDFKEDKSNYYIKAELPGIDKSNIDIEVESNKISIQAEKKQEKEEDNKKKHLSEIYYGFFSRVYHLDDAIDTDKVKANYENGVLHLKVPKLVSNKKSSKINIE